MSDKNSKPVAFKRTTLAAAIALTFSTPAAFAAPSANQLPGHGKVDLGNITNSQTPSNGSETINFKSNIIIKWGVAKSKSPNINMNQPGGFNIGSGATLDFNGTGTISNSVLNVDKSGNASQIMGTLKGTQATKAKKPDIFVANANGIIVGSGATISSNGRVGLIGGNVTIMGGGGLTYADGIGFNAPSGADVTVKKGANITSGSTILIAGGGNVNVNLGALKQGNSILLAGIAKTSLSLASNNNNAKLAVSGKLPKTNSPTLIEFESAGNAVNKGTLNLSHVTAHNALQVGKTFTNTGTLTLPAYFTTLHDVVKSPFKMVNSGQVTGTKESSSTVIKNNPFEYASLTNKGTYNSKGPIYVKGGDLSNSGTIDAGITAAGNTTNHTISAVNGSLTNSGTMKHVSNLDTLSNETLASASNKSSVDYSITNTGTISGLATINANGAGNRVKSTSGTDKTTGSIKNTGVLSFATISQLTGNISVKANNDINLGGTVNVGGSAPSASNPLKNLTMTSTKGNVTLDPGAPVVSKGNVILTGQQVSVMSDLSSVGTNGIVAINAGPSLKSKSKYAVRVAKGKTVSAGFVDVQGQQQSNGTAYDNPNVILQGKLSGNTIQLGGLKTNNLSPVSDVFSGPKGGLTATGTNPTVNLNFTGRIKTAPYTNDKSNFRYNDLLINAKSPMTLNLNPVKYQTNGTTGVPSGGSKSAVNIMVNNTVKVNSMKQPSSVPNAKGSSVTGINNWPNTHLVLQSTGNISLNESYESGSITQKSFYWPGLVYLGTVKTNKNGNAVPGSVSQYGTISAAHNVNNVLPGSTAKGGGMHFITKQPVSVSGNVVTNADSWVNFATDSLTDHFANQNANQKVFYGGSQGSGSVINYNLLPKGDFNTQLPNSKK